MKASEEVEVTWIQTLTFAKSPHPSPITTMLFIELTGKDQFIDYQQLNLS